MTIAEAAASAAWGAVSSASLELGFVPRGVKGKVMGQTHGQWIGLRENFKRKTPYLMGKSMASCRCSLKPIHWPWAFHGVFMGVPWNEASQKHGKKNASCLGTAVGGDLHSSLMSVKYVERTSRLPDSWSGIESVFCMLHATIMIIHIWLVGLLLGLLFPIFLESNKTCSKAPTRYHPIHQPFRGHGKKHCFPTVGVFGHGQKLRWNQASGWQSRSACGCCSWQ